MTIKPGWKSGTKITFPREGDQYPGHVPADIAFVIKDKPHPKFKRDGANIIYTHKLSLRDALIGTSLNVPTLDGTNYPLRIDTVIKPKMTRTIAGQGLPMHKTPTRRGDLIVEFDVRFPDSLSPSAKELVSLVGSNPFNLLNFRSRTHFRQHNRIATNHCVMFFVAVL